MKVLTKFQENDDSLGITPALMNDTWVAKMFLCRPRHRNKKTALAVFRGSVVTESRFAHSHFREQRCQIHVVRNGIHRTLLHRDHVARVWRSRVEELFSRMRDRIWLSEKWASNTNDDSTEEEEDRPVASATVQALELLLPVVLLLLVPRLVLLLRWIHYSVITTTTTRTTLA